MGRPPVSEHHGGKRTQEFLSPSWVPNHPKSYRLSFSLLRESDQEKPLTGWPQLPAKVWVGYLLDEMNLRNKEGLLRQA